MIFLKIVLLSYYLVLNRKYLLHKRLIKRQWKNLNKIYDKKQRKFLFKIVARDLGYPRILTRKGHFIDFLLLLVMEKVPTFEYIIISRKELPKQLQPALYPIKTRKQLSFMISSTILKPKMSKEAILNMDSRELLKIFSHE